MIFFIIPTYNEEKNIGLLLENIKALGYSKNNYQIIIVNDGSRDRTLEIIRSYENQIPIRVINHRENLGVGAVFRSGFTEALNNATPSDLIVTMEADNTSDLKILPPMLEKVSSQADLVLASCYAQNGRIEGTNPWRRFLSWGANLLLMIVFPIKGVKTYSSFYRVYNAGVLQNAFDAYNGHIIEQAGFVCMVEMLVKMHRVGVRISEVPMVLRIGMRKDTSKMRISRTIRDYISFIITDLVNRQKPFSKDHAKR